MICRSCIRAAARARLPQSSSHQTARFLSTTSILRNATATPTPPTTTSTTSQPLSDPLTPSAKKEKPKGAARQIGEATELKTQKSQPFVKSSIPAGTPLKGLNFLKNKPDPVALEDSEYPSWLWTILEKKEKGADAGAAGDLFSKSKKQRRLAAKRLRAAQLANPDLLVPKVPIYEQTIDLPAGDGSLEGAVQAASAREELTKALRNKRRATIKEANFLKAMG